MKNIRYITLLALLLTTTIGNSFAQFYETGRGRTSTKWQQIDSKSYKIVYPSTYYLPSRSIASLLDSIHPYINHSLDFPIQKVPIILHTENLYSNGYVTWAPKREELVMTPPQELYPLLWNKQLAVHEWRHVAQISTLRQGLTKVASWLLGEAGLSVGLFTSPRWILEGDAVLAETQFAEYGRGLQPDFTVEYRALFSEGWNNFNRLDRWICGSYNRHYPDIYKFGYQTLSAADTYLPEGYFGEMMGYGGKYPIFIMPQDIYLKHFHQTSFKKIAKRAFNELDSLWVESYNVDENFTHLTSTSNKTYTTYSSPVEFQGRILALKSDFDTPLRLVDIATDKDIKAIGTISSALTVLNNKIYYTEYVRHPIFEQVSFSPIIEFDPLTDETKIYHKNEVNFSLTNFQDNCFAAISIDSLSRGFIRTFDSEFNISGEYMISRDNISLNSLCWDSKTERLYYIALDNRGNYIGSLTPNGEIEQITKPSLVAIKHLDAGNGTLYFTSTQSGKDELHSLDLSSLKEQQLTTSRFGSINGSVSGDSLLFTTYTPRGYMVASTSINSPKIEQVEWSRLPKNILNPKRREWNVPKIDTIDLVSLTTPSNDSTNTSEWKKSSRFKAPFAVHSWAPISFDGDYFMQNRPMNFALGATAFFQSTLSTFNGFLTAGYLNESPWIKGRVLYKGLPLNISLGGEYGGGDQLFMSGVYPNSESLPPVVVNRKRYLSGDLTLSLPLNLSMAGYSKLLQPSFSLSYANNFIYNTSSNLIEEGILQYSASLWWSSYRNRAHRNLEPRSGYALRGSIIGGATQDFGFLYSLFGKLYLPGLFPNHSIGISAAIQSQATSCYNFGTKALYLEGVNDIYASKSYLAADLRYSLPVAYPDWGIEGVAYLKRIYATLYGGYSSGRYLTSYDQTKQINNYSYGVKLNFDLTLLRAYEQSLSLNFFMPNNKFAFSVGYSMDF